MIQKVFLILYQSVQGIARAINEAVEIAIEEEIPVDHPVMAWIVDHAATCLNLFKKRFTLLFRFAQNGTAQSHVQSHKLCNKSSPLFLTEKVKKFILFTF